MQQTSNREFAVVVVGAAGLTGRLVAGQIARHAHLLGGHGDPRGWAVSGRDRQRTAAALADLPGETPAIVEVDLNNAAELPAFTRRAAVVLNLAGPYGPTARHLIDASIATRTHYADLSGELPLLRDVVARFHDAATDAGVRIVQMAGWEALPADLATLLASRRAVHRHDAEGPGAAAPIEAVEVAARFHRLPTGRLPLSQAVSAGTLSSIVAMLEDPDAALIGRTDALLPTGAQHEVRPAKLRLQPFQTGNRMLAPFGPVAFLNPPIVHRTAALRAAEDGVSYRPADYSEGEDIGGTLGIAALPATGKAWSRWLLQRAVVGIANAPTPVRRGVANGLRRLVPPSGTGPSGRFLTDWEWTVRASARTGDGRTAEATLEGRGHPGYAATAAMIAEVGLRMALGRAPERFGCLTPALALGSLDLDPWFIDGIRLR